MQRWLAAWVALAIRQERRVIAVTGLLTLAALAYAALNLGVNMDNKTTMLSPDLPFQKRMAAFEERFPLLNDALLVVIDGETGEAARNAARRLASSLDERPDIARSVFVAEADPFFERHALLYRSLEDLETLSDQLVRFQPVLGELSRRPDLATLTHLIRRSLARALEPGPDELGGLLDSFGEATVAVYTERPLRISWQDLLLRESAFGTSTHSTLVVDPVLDFDALLPASRPLSEIRGVAAELGIGPEEGLRVRITGYPALNDEEMRGLVTDVGIAGLFSFAMVLVVLAWAFRSGSMVAASGVTLIVGLIWTAAFAAFAVGRLNVISIAFAVLFIGLGVDFTIHLGLHVLEERRRGLDHAASFAAAVRDVGPALVLCSVSTSLGFFAFVPTDYRGVAELGMISGSGMFVILALTLTLLPALHTRLLPIGVVSPEPAGRTKLRLPPGLVLAASLLAGLLAIRPLFALRFDSNVVKMRNPNTESVQTWNDLLATGTGSPWYVDILAANLDEAERLSARLLPLPEVAETRSLQSYVPDDQPDKLLILEDLALFLDVPAATEPASPPDEAAQIAALRALHDALANTDLGRTGGLARSGRLLLDRLQHFLERVESEADPAPVLAAVEESLLGRFPVQLARLRAALEPDAIDLAALPDRLRTRMLADDGTARLQVFPSADVTDDHNLVAFVTAVQKIAPEATGLPVNLVEFARTTSASLRLALAIAGGAIGLLLLVLWRRPRDALLALAPLALAGLWTLGVMGAIDQPFNFANVVVLPLLLGMGIDSGIHLVSRARSGGAAASDLAATTTGRAVFLSAFTTLVSFGSLATSGHRGVASLGVVLVIGMACTLVANLGTLTAWFKWRQGAGHEAAEEGAAASRGS